MNKDNRSSLFAGNIMTSSGTSPLNAQIISGIVDTGNFNALFFVMSHATITTGPITFTRIEQADEIEIYNNLYYVLKNPSDVPVDNLFAQGGLRGTDATDAFQISTSSSIISSVQLGIFGAKKYLQLTVGAAAGTIAAFMINVYSHKLGVPVIASDAE